MRLDGSDLTQLTSGNGEFYPKCSPDGNWVVYQSADELDPTIWKIPIEGGEPVRLTDTRALRPSVSPDGTLVAYHYLDPEPEGSKWRVGIASMDGGKRLKWFDFPPNVMQRIVRWSPDGRATVYPKEEAGLSDLWAQPLEGGPPRKITDLRADNILTFSWSHDARWLAYVRNVETSNVVLISTALQGPN
jgi:Tol biopolymer transport system component